MQFDVTHGAILKTRASEIVKGGRNAAQLGVLSRRDGQIRMALQTNIGDIVSREHSRVRRSMRFVTGAATFQLLHRMLIHKWTALVAVALQTSRLITKRSAHAVSPEAGMRIVTIDTAHRSFLEAMFVRPVEGSPLRNVASGALGVDIRFFVIDELGAPRSVHGMA